MFDVASLAFAAPFVLAIAALTVPATRPLVHGVRAAQLAGVVVSITIISTALARGNATSSPWLRWDTATAVMGLLIAGLGVVLTRYARSYLAGAVIARRFTRGLLGTLAAVHVIVLANHLAVIVGAWFAVSLAVHGLLASFPERRTAVVVAHKKFVLSRTADVFAVAALVLIGGSTGSLAIDEITRAAMASAQLPTAAAVGAVLLVLAVILRSALLPFHGWLIQVMEAPTPVSALLHAGVVNIGGFVLLRVGALIDAVPSASWLLLIFGGASAVVASLVMITRSSIKVHLAWSTCAQMGFMLLQCGLGAWHLVLLHLVAHSLYKAHAFASAGETVARWRTLVGLRPPPRPLTADLTARAFAIACVLVVGAAVSWSTTGSPSMHASTLMFAIVLGAVAGPMLTAGSRGWRGRTTALLRVAGVAAVFFLWHTLAGSALPTGAADLSPWRWGFAGALLLGLLGVQLAIDTSPRGRVARSLLPRLSAGLRLDEAFTRVAFRVWPPAPRQTPRAALPILTDTAPGDVR